MEKLQRNYRLFVDASDGKRLEVSPPFSIEFDIKRGILSQKRDGNIRIYNLKEETRLAILQNVNDFSSPRKVELWAGYQDQMPIIFRGTISYCWSAREGINFITTIEAYDAGFELITSQVNKAYKQGILEASVMEDMIKTMAPGVTLGAISDYNSPLSKGNSYSGNTGELLNQISGGAFFCDLGKAYVLKDSDCIRGSLLEINSDSGLLGTPIREQTILHLEMLFEPRLLIGQLVNLNSTTGRLYNGPAKVVSLTHRGMISDSVCGSVITSVGLWYGFTDPPKVIN